jgi:ubiquinone biosynthesis monooxygenase Coq7
VLSVLDRGIIEFDKVITTLWGTPPTTDRPVPDADLVNPELSQQEQNHAAALMRVNHAGEVSAQALYQGQALTAKLPDVRESMEHSAIEENDHLVWCENRLIELNSHKSVLNPAWYAGSFAIGAIAGKLGDQWSLGFVAETEKQVIRHLEEHLDSISEQDIKSRAVLNQMKEDEAKHGALAADAGGAELPLPVRKLMGLVSKVMTKTSYYI